MDISVIIPYNEDRGYLAEAIKSAEEQDFAGSYEIILQQGDVFLGENINRALRRTKGEWIKVLSEDDILPPNSLSDLYNGINGGRWICGDAENFGLLKEGWEHSPIYKSKVASLGEMLRRNCIHGGTTMYQRELLFEVGGYDESLWTGEEYDLHLLLISKGYYPDYVPKVVYRYRLHEHNKSVDMSVKDKHRRRAWIERNIKTRYR